MVGTAQLKGFGRAAFPGLGRGFAGASFASWAWFFTALPIAFLLGRHVDNAEVDRMTKFRDKSVLYAGTKMEGDTEESWGNPKGSKTLW